MAARNSRIHAYLTTILPDISTRTTTAKDSPSPTKLKPLPNGEELQKKCQAQLLEAEKNIRCILNKYNKQLGYLKKYHARSDAKTQMAELMKECPPETIEKITRRASHDDYATTGGRRKLTGEKWADLSESPDKTPSPPKPGVPKKVAPESTKRGRSVSRAIEEKFQNIFQENGSCSNSPVYKQQEYNFQDFLKECESEKNVV